MYCARTAGFEVSVEFDDESNEEFHILNCLEHQDPDFSMKAKVRNLVELMGEGGDVTAANTLHLSSKALNGAARVLGQLAWGWRWSEWWIEHGDGGRDGKGEVGTDGKEARKKDARNCRLMAVSAAIRGREYDRQKGLSHGVLTAALLPVARTKSLVGDLKEEEVEFLVLWLGRAYRAGMDGVMAIGYSKIPVTEAAYGRRTGTVGKASGEGRKDVLGTRSLPGKASYDSAKGGRPLVGFESDPNDFDDYELLDFTTPSLYSFQTGAVGMSQESLEQESVEEGEEGGGGREENGEGLIQTPRRTPR